MAVPVSIAKQRLTGPATRPFTIAIRTGSLRDTYPAKKDRGSQPKSPGHSQLLIGVGTSSSAESVLQIEEAADLCPSRDKGSRQVAPDEPHPPASLQTGCWRRTTLQTPTRALDQKAVMPKSRGHFHPRGPQNASRSLWKVVQRFVRISSTNSPIVSKGYRRFSYSRDQNCHVGISVSDLERPIH